MRIKNIADLNFEGGLKMLSIQETLYLFVVRRFFSLPVYSTGLSHVFSDAKKGLNTFSDVCN